MEITERPPTRFDLPGREEPVYIATQRWALEPWDGEDPPGLAKIWSRKPKFAVNASRSCAELAIVYHLRNEGWHGVWVNSFGPRELRSEWFPAPAARTLAETGAPAWAVEAFDRLRAANGGSLGGFFDVFAWREPGEVRFYEAKARCRAWTPPGCLRADSTLKWDAAAPGLQAQAAISRDRGRSQQASLTGRYRTCCGICLRRSDLSC